MQETKREPEEKTIDDLVTDVKGYLNVRVEYLRLYAVERVSKIFAEMLTKVAVIISFMLAFLFGSVTLAFYLASVFESNTAGFGAVALIYILIAMLVFITKKSFLERALTNFAINTYFSKLEEEEKEENETV